MKNLYHVLYSEPLWEKPLACSVMEGLAQELAASGLLRIDADTKSNFGKMLDPDIQENIVISKEELGPDLIEKTKARLNDLYASRFSGKLLEHKINNVISIIKNSISKSLNVEHSLIVQIARLLVQSTHPVILRYALLDNVEIFVSYGNSIGDVMDVVTWKAAGQNSGMQSTNEKKVIVYVSCGGNPFAETQNFLYGDGWPAIARLQIVAAQELGHYSDIKRDNLGRHMGRHSMAPNFYGPSMKVGIGRKEDIDHVKNMHKTLVACGLGKMLDTEQKLKFYAQNKIKTLSVLLMYLFYLVQKWLFLRKLSAQNLDFFRLHKFNYIASSTEAIVHDMLFNLAPVADVYKDSDPQIEEGIACAEALARVPQQVMKWGYLTTQSMMPTLYQIYYNQVIPGLIASYEAQTDRKIELYNTQAKCLIKEILKKEAKPPVDIDPKIDVIKNN